MKRLLILVSSLIIIVNLAGCSEKSEPLRLGSMPTYSAGIYAVGIEKGFFKEAGVDVELKVFRSARERDSGAIAGELDGFMTDIMGGINLNAKGFPFIMTSSEYEIFSLMSSGDLKSSESTNKTIGISENTVIEFILDTYVEESNKKVNIAALPDRMGALFSGELDYGLFPQPFTEIIKANGGEIIFSTDSQEFYPVVLVFDQEYLEENEGLVKAFYEGYVNTINYMQENNFDEYKDILVNTTLATEENVDLYQLPVGNFALRPVDETSFNDIKAWMESKDLLEVDIDFNYIQTSKFMK